MQEIVIKKGNDRFRFAFEVDKLIECVRQLNVTLNGDLILQMTMAKPTADYDIIEKHYKTVPLNHFVNECLVGFGTSPKLLQSNVKAIDELKFRKLCVTADNVRYVHLKSDARISLTRLTDSEEERLGRALKATIEKTTSMLEIEAMGVDYV